MVLNLLYLYLLTLFSKYLILWKIKVTTILNYAPAVNDPISNELFKYTDYLIVNEVEASQLSGVEIKDLIEDVKRYFSDKAENYN